MEYTKMYYIVPDVEHMGDVDYDVSRLRGMGATSIDTSIEWDDDEIEEATIYFEVPESSVRFFLDFDCYLL